jgi:hypothetical protein
MISVSNGTRHCIEGTNYNFFTEKMKDKPKYRWNSEFVTLINENVCPYCDDPLVVKGITKECHCSFYLIGACETLAYEVISQDAPIYYGNERATEFCPECGTLSSDFIDDHKHAEKICKCGLVMQGPPSYSSWKHISYDSFNNPKGAVQ